MIDLGELCAIRSCICEGICANTEVELIGTGEDVIFDAPYEWDIHMMIWEQYGVRGFRDEEF